MNFIAFYSTQNLLEWSKAKNKRFYLKHLMQGASMASVHTPKINVRNSVSECAQSLRKENTGKYQNYSIKDCIVSIAATKMK